MLLHTRHVRSMTALATSAALLLFFVLLSLVTYRGLGHFWPPRIALVNGPDQPPLFGEVLRTLDDGSLLLLVSSRGKGGTPLEAVGPEVTAQLTYPHDVGLFRTVERLPVFGTLEAFVDRAEDVPGGAREDPWARLDQRLQRSRELRREIHALETVELGVINARVRTIDLELGRRVAASDDNDRWFELRAERLELMDAFDDTSARLEVLRNRAAGERIEVRQADGSTIELSISDLTSAIQPNALGWFARLVEWFRAMARFVTEDPVQSNLGGGVFPALVGTVLLVFLAAILVAPLGVLVATYLSEYAQANWTTRLIRSAIGNLAAVPSIVYGVFGLALFVYTIGGSLDRLLFPDQLPTATFGTGGMLWAALTLALLTLPVVIVSTEEALARVPRSVREASSALGATRLETISRTVLPMASPGILTGLVLAMARAAGEVAPLLLVGVVNVAQSLPVDHVFPYLHLERKFMHLGFHIYDLALQSPSLAIVESAVFATALLLLAVILILNLSAIVLRNRLREHLKAYEGGR